MAQINHTGLKKDLSSLLTDDFPLLTYTFKLGLFGSQLVTSAKPLKINESQYTWNASF